MLQRGYWQEMTQRLALPPPPPLPPPQTSVDKGHSLHEHVWLPARQTPEPAPPPVCRTESHTSSLSDANHVLCFFCVVRLHDLNSRPGCQLSPSLLNSEATLRPLKIFPAPTAAHSSCAHTRQADMRWPQQPPAPL
eukprot:3933157-Rhodomonas_salina.1